MWLGLAFGENMFSTDMVQFTGDGDGSVTDLWSTGLWKPETDTVQNYSDITKSLSNGVYSFTAYRFPMTGDSAQDSTIECGKTNQYAWAVQENTPGFAKHSNDGKWTLSTQSDCSGALAADGAMNFAVTALMFTSIIASLY